MMMAWSDGIPIARNLDCAPFQFDIEFELPEQKEYRFVHYGFTFLWYRDDKTGQKIIDECLEMRPTESVRYSAYLKRPTNQYRKGKSTSAFRNLMLESNVLAIDVLSSLMTWSIHLYQALKNLNISMRHIRCQRQVSTDPH